MIDGESDMKAQQQKSQRRAIKKRAVQSGFSETRNKVNKLFGELDHWEQAEVVADLTRKIADAFAEDRLDHEIIEQRRHEEKLGRPWAEVRKELGLKQATRNRARK